MPTMRRVDVACGRVLALVFAWRKESPPRLIAGEDVLLAEAEKYHDLLFLWVYTLPSASPGG
jgi:hypothetical protein